MKALTKEEAARRAALVDELGAIQERLAKVKLDQAREKAIKDEIRDIWMDGVKASQPRAFQGAAYIVEVSARKIERLVDVARLYKRIGLKRFLTIATVTLKQLGTLEPEDQAGMIVSEQTGSRDVRVVRALKPAAAQRAA